MTSFLDNIEITEVSKEVFEANKVRHDPTEEEIYLKDLEAGKIHSLSHICEEVGTVPCKLRRDIRDALRALFPDNNTRNANWDIKHGVDPSNSERSVLMINRVV